MAHFELNVESGESCSGTQGSYVGNLYHTSRGRQQLTLTRTKLGTYNAALNDPVTMIQYVRNIAEKQEGYSISPDRIAALGLLRLCFRRRHVDAELAVGMVPTLERVASLAVAKSMDDIEPVWPLSGRERNISANGIGHARRLEEGASDINPLIHLPVSRVEGSAYPVTAAVGTSADSYAMSLRPYVALHGHRHYLEHIVLLDELS